MNYDEFIGQITNKQWTIIKNFTLIKQENATVFVEKDSEFQFTYFHNHNDKLIKSTSKIPYFDSLSVHFFKDYTSSKISIKNVNNTFIINRLSLLDELIVEDSAIIRNNTGLKMLFEDAKLISNFMSSHKCHQILYSKKLDMTTFYLNKNYKLVHTNHSSNLETMDSNNQKITQVGKNWFLIE